MPQFNLTFTGICTFVDDFKRVLLGNFDQPRPAKNNASFIVPAHYAYLRIPISQLLTPVDEIEVAQKFTMDYRDLMTEDTVPTVVIFLDQFQVSVSPIVNNRYVDKDPPPSDPEVPQNDDERRKVHWIADLSYIYPGHDEVDDRYLVANPPAAIVAYVNTEYAGIYCIRVPDDSKYSFDPPVTSFKRSLAVGVNAEFVIPANAPIMITLRSYDPKQPFETTIALKPRNGWAIIGNSPLDAILNLGHVHECVNGALNYDFELFYDLVINKPTSAWPIPKCEPIEGGEWKDLGSENCPPASAKP